MIEDHNPELSLECRKIVECDTARISEASGTLFLIIGFNRNTKDDEGQWYKMDKDGNQVPKDWDYVQESVVAHGKTEEQLIKSAEYYKKLCGMTMMEFLKE